jgi:hypothetical protein
MILFALVLAAAPFQEAFKGELAETLGTAPDATFEARKRPQDVEICIADAFTSVGAPAVFRQGDNEVVIASFYGSGDGVFAAATLKSGPEALHVELRVRGNGWDERMKSRVGDCLRR